MNIKAGDKIVALTDVLLRDKWRDKATEFIVADEPKRGARPIEVDTGTAQAWGRNGWIKEIAKTPAVKPVDK